MMEVLILILTLIRIMKLKDKNVRKITRVGKTSLAVTLPIEIVRELNWRERQRVVVKRTRGGVIIKDFKK
jgi:bifunctional DNA-binding transcriptional regulator/antitoxin component of YhaV-PrlF toxin-antitoxin module